VQADYLLNKDYIAKVLCINEAKPQMHCEGKCCLARKLKEQEKQDQQAPNSRKEKFDIQPFFLPKQLSLVNIRFSHNVEYPTTEDLINSSFHHSIFHPPNV